MAQKNNLCGEVAYTFSTNLDYTFQEKYLLSFNNNFSFSEEIIIKKSDSKKSEENKPKGTQVNVFIGRENLTSKYYYNSRKAFYFRDIFLDEVILVKEESLKDSWKFHAETKSLSNLLCKKATIQFRGRNYTAWYAPKIPVPFGPWKLRGLPGMILEFYDTDKVFHVIANSIKVGKDNCFSDIDKKDLEKAVSLSFYIKRKEELVDKMFAKMSAKRPKGSRALKRDKKCEDCSKEIELFDEKN
jgi:GLPGLI family protein